MPIDPLTYMTEAERRGAMLALAHVRTHAARLRHHAEGPRKDLLVEADRRMLAHSARAVELAVDLTGRAIATPARGPRASAALMGD
jgi:hypothetical protein